MSLAEFRDSFRCRAMIPDGLLPSDALTTLFGGGC